MASKMDVVGSVVSGTNKKETVLDKINKRNKERQNYLESQVELRNKQQHEIEGADFFTQTFTVQVKIIENNISNTKTASKLDLTRQFSAINNDIQELQKYLTQSTMFLPDYNIKAFQNILNDLKSTAEDVRFKLLPKKKFGFNRKAQSTPPASPKIDPSKNINLDQCIKSKISTKAFVWTLSNRTNEHIELTGSQVNGQDLTISNLENCLIEIRGYAGSLQISHTKNTTILCGPISRSLFAENCTDCTVVAACQQLRLHSSVNCKLWLHVTCQAIIEDSNQIVFGDYHYQYDGIDMDFSHAELDKDINNYKDVADFNWLSPDQASPNWRLVDDTDSINKDTQIQYWRVLRDNFQGNKTQI